MLHRQLPVEQFEAALSQSTVPSLPPKLKVQQMGVQWKQGVLVYIIF